MDVAFVAEPVIAGRRPWRAPTRAVPYLLAATVSLLVIRVFPLAGQWTLLAGIVDALTSAVPLVVGVSMVLGPRAARRDEVTVSRWLGAAACLVGSWGELTVAVARAEGTAAAVLRAAAAATMIASCACAYQALVRWSWARSGTSDPGDWLNGISATFTAAAVINLVPGVATLLGHGDTTSGEFAVFQAAAALVLVGTLPSVAVLSGLERDRRFWLVAAGLCAGVITPTIAMVTPGVAPALHDLAAMGVVGVAWVRTRKGRSGSPRTATSQASTVGALLVLSSSVAVLAVAALAGAAQRGMAIVLALTAVAGVSTRLFTLVRELAAFTETRREAMTDDLTGIANRRTLIRRLTVALGQDAQFTLTIMNIDRFKQINDRLGHAVGDDLLIAIGHKLTDRRRPGRFVARLGGDEFAVVFDGNDVAAHLELVRQLLAEVTEPILVLNQRLRFSISAGGVSTAVPGNDGCDAGELLRRADAAMCLAKATGGGLASFDSQLDAVAQSRSNLLQQLQTMADPNESHETVGHLVTYFQPQVETGTALPRGAEALVRWQHPTLGLLGPDAFLDLTEQHGLMDMVTTTVLRTAVASASTWRRDGWDLVVAVNVAPSCLRNVALPGLIRETLAEFDLPPDRLVVEITETHVIGDPAAAMRALQAIVDLGVGVSLDDYGTGYSSLSYLKDLPASELKLDRSFTAELIADERTASIVAGTVDLAHRLNLSVVAEGVEDEQTAQALLDLGCERSQGYLHGRPMSAADFAGYLRRWHDPLSQTASTTAA